MLVPLALQPVDLLPRGCDLAPLLSQHLLLLRQARLGGAELLARRLAPFFLLAELDGDPFPALQLLLGGLVSSVRLLDLALPGADLGISLPLLLAGA